MSNTAPNHYRPARYRFGIGDFRRYVGISQRKLAKILGVSQGTVSGWEMGLQGMSLKSASTWLKWAHAESRVAPGINPKLIPDVHDLAELADVPNSIRYSGEFRLQTPSSWRHDESS